jgi:hypothetical protein
MGLLFVSVVEPEPQGSALFYWNRLQQFSPSQSAFTDLTKKNILGEPVDFYSSIFTTNLRYVLLYNVKKSNLFDVFNFKKTLTCCTL